MLFASPLYSAFLVLTTRYTYLDIHSPKDTLRVFPFWKMQNAHDKLYNQPYPIY